MMLRPIRRGTGAGFTLIEVLVVMVIAATPQRSQALADAACGGDLAVDHVGQRGVWRAGAVRVDAASEACWRR